MVALVVLAGVPATAHAAPARLSAAPAATTPVHLVLGLHRRQAALERFVDRVSDPSSPDYRRYLSPARIDARFGAAPATRRAVLGFLRAHGADARMGPSGAFVEATLPAARAASLLGTRWQRLGAAGASRLPTALAPYVDAVVGLDDGPARLATPRAEPSGGATGSGSASRTGTAIGCPEALTEPGFAPNQYRAAYGYARMRRRGYTGRGQRVGVIAQAGVKRADVATFARCFGLAVPPIREIDVDDQPIPPNPSEVEVTLDVEMLVAAAPRLAEIQVYQATTAAGLVRAYAAPLRQPRRARPGVLTTSIVSCEAAYPPTTLRLIEHAIAADAAAGVTVLAAAGDSGSSGCVVDGVQGAALGVVVPSFPASSPHVTGVGGTSVTLDAANRIVGEALWNDEPARFLAGGGGPSLIFARPWYQRAAHTPGRTRSTPDVAMLADRFPGILTYCSTPICVAGTDPPGGGFRVTGFGTSAATPLLAGGIALANEQAAAHGQAPLGALNPLLYRIGRDRSRAAAVFRDITTGSNDLGAFIAAAANGGAPLGCCAARPGYDRATGWGSVNVAALADAAVAAG